MEQEGAQRYLPIVVIAVIVVVVLAVVFLIVRNPAGETEQAAAPATSVPSSLSGDAASIAQERG